MLNLQQKIKSCTKCNLCKDMPGTLPVPGVGPVDAKLMLVGEALGEDESLLEEPFVGKCGQLLDKILLDAGLKREDLYITNVVKCRPTNESGKANRPPSSEEIFFCKSWLWQEIKLVNPKCIVTLGKVPTHTLLRTYLNKNFTLGKVFGKNFKVDYCDSIIVPCWHPSYLMMHGRKHVDSTTELLKTIGGCL